MLHLHENARFSAHSPHSGTKPAFRTEIPGVPARCVSGRAFPKGTAVKRASPRLIQFQHPCADNIRGDSAVSMPAKIVNTTARVRPLSTVSMPAKMVITPAHWVKTPAHVYPLSTVPMPASWYAHPLTCARSALPNGKHTRSPAQDR